MSRRGDAGPPTANDNGEAAGKLNEKVTSSSFTALIRSRTLPDNTGVIIERAMPEEALRAALAHEVRTISEPIIKWAGRDQAVALDLDREGDIPIDPEEVDQYFPETLPRPLAAWATHGGGLRPLFVACDGVSALELAAVWALLAPLGRLAGWRTEVKTDSRHPSGTRDGARCGRVEWFAPSANIIVPGNGRRSVASEKEIAIWLDTHGLMFGRHPTERCPWCGTKPADGSPAVVISERGIRCFRCSRSMSWDQLVGVVVLDDRPSLYDAASALVHLPHQVHILRDLRPSLPEELLQPAWIRVLREVHRAHLESDDEKERDHWEKLVARAASNNVDVVRATSGAWLDAQTLLPRKLNPGRTLKEMPWCRSATMVDAADASGPLRGFVPVQPVGHDEVIGPYVDPPTGSIFVVRAARGAAPPSIVLGERPPDPAKVADAWAELKRLLVGLDRGYLSGQIAARFFSQRGIAAPRISAVTGRTGSGKTATQHLAAGATGTQAGIVVLRDSRDTLRQIGLHLERGCGLLFIDEVGRVADVYRRLEPILALNSTVTFEAKYANERPTAMTAAVSLIGSTLPLSIVRSPELSRRAVGWRLLHQTSNWDADVGELGNARENELLRPHLDLITASIWWEVHALGPNGSWRALCMKNYEGVQLSGLDQLDVDGAGRAEAIRLLYEYYRRAPEGDLYTGAAYRGWLLANPQTAAGNLLGELIDFDGDRAQNHAEIADLQRQDLALALGFSTPMLRLLVVRHSAKWLAKFEEEGVMRGRGRPRKDLPAAVVAAAEKPLDIPKGIGPGSGREEYEM